MVIINNNNNIHYTLTVRTCFVPLIAPHLLTLELKAGCKGT